MSILIVDDSRLDRLILKSILQKEMSEEVVTAHSAWESFEHLKMEDPESEGSGIDLILMDVMMPEIDGIEACRRIMAKPHLHDIPIILVTAGSDSRTLASAFEAGATDFINKPPSPVELLARVRSGLHLKREVDRSKLAYIELAEKNLDLEAESVAKSQILSTVSHELKTPLTSIVGYIERLLLHADKVGWLNARQQRYLETIQRNSFRLKALIDNLLDISRIESGSFELNYTQVDAQQEINDVLETMQLQINEKQMRIILDIPSDIQSLWADRLRFSQVISNLVSNASKYSPVGATMTIMAVERAGLIQFDVSDTGRGISRNDQTQLFSKFFRVDNSSSRESAGTGLGLFITKYIVEAHGGRIWVESEEGKGSTFSFTFPSVDSESAWDFPPAQASLAAAS